MSREKYERLGRECKEAGREVLAVMTKANHIWHLLEQNRHVLAKPRNWALPAAEFAHQIREMTADDPEVLSIFIFPNEGDGQEGVGMIYLRDDAKEILEGYWEDLKERERFLVDRQTRLIYEAMEMWGRVW